MRVAHQVGVEEVLPRQNTLRGEGDGACRPILSTFVPIQRITSS
jgi:hypothetical protein